MSRLPVLSGRELVKVLEKLGWAFDYQEGSHIALREVSPPFRRVTIPNHREVAKGTLRSILRRTGLSSDDLQTLL